MFTVLFLVYGTTISGTPLLNILVSGKNLPLEVLELIYCKGNFANGVKKNGTFICNIFLKHMINIYPNKSMTDVVMLYGASNVQLGGDLMNNNYPNLNLMCGVEHTLSLFFNDISKLPIVNQMIIYHKAI